MAHALSLAWKDESMLRDPRLPVFAEVNPSTIWRREAYYGDDKLASSAAVNICSISLLRGCAGFRPLDRRVSSHGILVTNLFVNTRPPHVKGRDDCNAAQPGCVRSRCYTKHLSL